MRNAYIRINNKDHMDAVLSICEGTGGDSFQIFVMCPVDMESSMVNALLREKVPLIADLPDIARENMAQKLRSDLMSAKWAQGVVIKNVDEMGLLKECAFEGMFVADPFLYAYNSEAMNFYLEHFPDMLFIASDELTDEEIDLLPGRDRLIYKIYGRQRVMFTAQDLGEDFQRSPDGNGEDGISLKLARGDRFMAYKESYGYTSIHMKDPVSMLDKSEALGRDNVFIDLSFAGRGEAFSVMNKIFGGEENDKSSAKAEVHEPVQGRINRGHHYRGIE